MGKIVIGTSGYSYKDWVGPFYPAKTKESEFLSYYANTFGYVELNFSYYAMPSSSLIANMAQKTSPSFLFGIKAHKSLTHEIDSTTLEESVSQFKKGIDPLADTGKLGAILFQFPYSFHYTPDNRVHLDKVLAWFREFPTAVEFRNSEWLKDKVFEALRERNAGLVSVDEPALPKLLRPSDIVTSSLGYIRFHGRNESAWWAGTNISRYDYLYNEEELSGWIPRIEKMIEAARILIIAFNNHFNGQAVKNAIQLKGILTSHGFADIV